MGRDDRKKNKHDQTQGNWHARHGRHGEDGAPPPVPGADTVAPNARILSASQARRYTDQKLIEHTRRLDDGNFEVVFRKGKMPPELR